MSAMGASTSLSTWEKVLIFLQIPGAVIFGLGPFLIPGILIPILGYAGDDPYIARVAGSAVFGYAVAAVLAIREGDWLAARFFVLATLVFHITSLLACALEFAGGTVQPVVYAIIANSLLQAIIAAWLLYRHRDVHGGKPNIPREAIGLMVVAMLAAGATGLAAFLVPVPLGRLLGYHATDVLLYRLAGTATLGYFAMAVAQLRTRNWTEMRLPVTMAFVFNGLGLIATLISMLSGEPLLLSSVILLATIIVTPGSLYALIRMGGPTETTALRAQGS